jgi:type IV pilus biogenesis protein CpaD/CtpE
MRKKIIILILLLGLTGCRQKLGADLKVVSLEIDKEITSLESRMEEEKVIEDKTAKYQMIEPYIKDKVKYWVDEYDYGKHYQITIQKPDGSTMSTGSGIANGRFDFEWTEPITSTSTLW